MNDDAELNRLRWQCRRGMLELDLLLLGFLETRYPRLDPNTQQAFENLLKYPDQLLLHWLISAKSEMTVDESVKSIVSLIRAEEG